MLLLPEYLENYILLIDSLFGFNDNWILQIIIVMN